MPDDLPPPVIAATPADGALASAVDEEALEATGRMEPVTPEIEPELDARELKALSRQERKEAKAALRREQQEARNAARQAKATAKAAAKAGLVAPAAAGVSDLAAEEDLADEIGGDVAAPSVADLTEGETEAPESTDATATTAPTDPRARAAQRVQRRLGKDADKLSAAEARARAREEARRRRAQAKEQRSGVVAEEAVRPPEGATEENLAEDVSVVEPLDEQMAEAELFVAEPEVEQTAIAEPVIDEPEPDLPNPVIGQRIEEPAPVDEVEPIVAEEPEPVIEREPLVETREIAKPVPPTSPMGDEESTSRSSLAPIAGVVGLIALGVSVLLAVGALLVALGLDSGGLYDGLRTVANLLVGPLKDAFDFSGANAERKEHFLAWGAGSIIYLLISFAGQAVQRANDEE